MIEVVPGGHRQSPAFVPFSAALVVARFAAASDGVAVGAIWGSGGHLRVGMPAALCWCWHQRAPDDPAPPVPGVGDAWGAVIALSGPPGFVPWTAISPDELIADVEARPDFYLQPGGFDVPVRVRYQVLMRHFASLWLVCEDEAVPELPDLGVLLHEADTPVAAAAAAIVTVNELALSLAGVAGEVTEFPAVGEACPNLALQAGLLYALAPAARLKATSQ